MLSQLLKALAVIIRIRKFVEGINVMAEPKLQTFAVSIRIIVKIHQLRSLENPHAQCSGLLGLT